MQPGPDQPDEQCSILEESGQWVLLAPVRSLDVTREVDFEFRVDRCNFIDRDHLRLRMTCRG